MNPTTTQDPSTAQRIRDEWNKVKAALVDFTGDQIQDPLGADGLLTIKLKFFKANGGGEVCLLKGQAPEDHRYTRFRAWGENVEKCSYLVKANGSHEFHKRRVEGDSQVYAADAMDSEDQAWAQGL